MQNAVTAMIVALTLAFAAPVAAQDYDVGLEAYQRGDYAAALHEIRPLAEQGDARAQNSLGVMYRLGQGVAQDFVEAVRWYREAADQGYAKAQLNLGVMYDYGRGVPKNNAEAVKWYRKAAEKGYTLAQYSLGNMHFEGSGVPENNVKAYMWWSLAKARGHKDAAHNLNIIKNRMTPADISKAQELAAKWWEDHND